MLRQSAEVIFIDEFHYIKNASKLFKALYDLGDSPKIYASGSSSLEIHTHLKESLAGRKRLYHIFPCALSEIEQAIPQKTSEYYYQYGGMPGTIHQNDPIRKKQLLSDILQSYILKDIKALIREENLRAFNHLIYLLAQTQGNLVSIDGLSREVGMSAQTYVNFPVYSYSQNLGNELKKSKKYYLYDIGIRNALLKNFALIPNRNDSGTIVETFVFLELQRQLTPETEIRFWRLKSGEEVDFLWIYNQIPYPIEVKLNWHSDKIPKGLAAFLRRYPDTTRAFVATKQKRNKTRFNQTTIIWIEIENAKCIPHEIAS